VFSVVQKAAFLKLENSGSCLPIDTNFNVLKQPQTGIKYFNLQKRRKKGMG